MFKKNRTTLDGSWLKAYIRRIQRCYVCGRALKKTYVPQERCRRYVCSSCGQITYINPKVVAAMIPVMPDGRVVLLKRKIDPAKGRWSYPAGYQEMGETVREAAERETREEIRTRVKAKELLGVYSYRDAGVVTIVYLGDLLNGQDPSPGHEAQDVKAFAVGEIPWKHLAFRSSVQALRDWMKSRRLKQTKAVPPKIW